MPDRPTPKKFTPRQPQDGDGVLCCAHIDPPFLIPKRFHWFLLQEDGGPCSVRRSDGAEFHVSWLIVCDDCFTRYDNPEDAAAHDLVWNTLEWGPEPIIEEDPPQ